MEIYQNILVSKLGDRKLQKTSKNLSINRDGSRDAATSKMERFVIIVNGWKLLTIITKRSMLDVAAVLDPPLIKANACLD